MLLNQMLHHAPKRHWDAALGTRDIQTLRGRSLLLPCHYPRLWVVMHRFIEKAKTPGERCVSYISQSRRATFVVKCSMNEIMRGQNTRRDLKKLFCAAKYREDLSCESPENGRDMCFLFGDYNIIEGSRTSNIAATWGPPVTHTMTTCHRHWNYAERLRSALMKVIVRGAGGVSE